MFASDKAIQNAPELLRLFAIASATEWSLLPVDGGLYDQHPEFIDGINVVFKAKSDHQERERMKRERESRRKKR